MENMFLCKLKKIMEQLKEKDDCYFESCDN